MRKSYVKDIARPVSISMKPKHVEKMDIERGDRTRSVYIQDLIEADGDVFTVADASTKQLLVALANRSDLPNGLTAGFLLTCAGV
jgi:hypothetical protein